MNGITKETYISLAAVIFLVTGLLGGVHFINQLKDDLAVKISTNATRLVRIETKIQDGDYVTRRELDARLKALEASVEGLSLDIKIILREIRGFPAKGPALLPATDPEKKK